MNLAAILPFLATGAVSFQEVERLSPALPPVSEPIRHFEEAIGWRKDADGEWHSTDRKLESAFSRGEAEGTLSLGLDEFRSLEWRTVEQKGKKLPVMIITRTHGGYVYPSIHRDWVTWREATVLIFEKFPFVEPTRYEFGKTFAIEAESVRWTGYDPSPVKTEPPGPLQEQEIQAIIGRSMNRPKEPDRKHRFKMVVFPVEHQGMKKVRFLFEAFNVKDQVPASVKRLSPDMYLDVSTQTFNYLYYETSFDVFRDFFSPLESVKQ